MTKAKDLLQFAGGGDDLDIEKSQKDWKTMNNPFLDDRPLTDETLEELGFERRNNLYFKECNGIELHSKISYPKTEREVFIWFVNKSKYKTVGKVRMLIEALKGDK